MNKILKQILLTAKDVAIETATTTVPGASVVIGGVEKLLDKDNSNNSQAVTELGAGIITAVQSLDSTHIKDASLVNSGIAKIQSGIEDLKHGLK